MNIQEIRSQYPMYSDLSDQELADGFHSKFYSDIPKTDFYTKLGIKQGNSFLSQIGKSIVGGVGAAADFIAPANLAVPGLIEGARTLAPESLGGISTEQAAQNITSGNIPGTQVSYAALQPSTMARGILGMDLETGQREQEQANIPLHALSKGADILGSFVNEKTNSPLLATAANLGVATAGLMGAHKAAVKGTDIATKGLEKFRKQPAIDPKLEAALSESELLKFKEQQKKQNAIPLEYDPGFAEGNVSREPAPLEMPAVEFPLEPKSPTRPLYNVREKLTTEQEFYDLLKAEEAKLTPDVDTTGVRNPYLQGDTKANVEVDSVSGRPIFPDQTKVDNTITKPDGSPKGGVYHHGDDFVTINPDAIARLWLRLTPEKKAEMGLRSAEDLQTFVELHERQHMSDVLNNGTSRLPGESNHDIEARVNRRARDNLRNFLREEETPVTSPKEATATEGFQPAATRTEYSDRFTTDLQSGKFNDPVARQKEIVAKRKRLEKVDERVRNALEASLRNPRDIASMKTYEEALDLKNRMEVELEALGKLEKNKRAPDMTALLFGGTGKKQGGAVNFGFAEAIVDRFKKAKENIPSLKTFADHIQRDVDDPVVVQLYKKYYGKDLTTITPQEAAVSKIPGLKETISSELQPLEQMVDRWKTETDISDAPLARALRENFSSGGRMTAMRTGNSFIDWNVENILGETRRAQVVVKRLQNDIKGEVKKITGNLFGQFKDKGKGIDSFVEAMGVMLKEEGKNTLVTASPEARLLVDKIRRSLDDLGTKIKAELESQGVKSFNWRPNYLAGVFFGPYRSIVRDATGKTIGVVAGRTKAEATAAIDHVKKAMPDAQFDVAQYNPKFDSGPGSLGARYGKASEVLELLKNQDESAQLLQTSLSDYYAKVQEDYLGYKQHFKPKKGVFGSEGNRPWENARNNAYDLLEAQLGIIDHGYHWLAEQKLMKDMDQILTNPDIALPEAKRYVNQYLDHAFGRTEDHVKILDSAIDYTARFMGISPSAFKETASILRNTALTGVLGVSGGFVVTQFVQVPQALSVGFTKAIGEGFHGSKIGSALIGGMDLVNGINGKFENMTPEGRYAFEYFTKNGVMEPHLVEHSLGRKVVTTTGMTPIQKGIWEGANVTLKGMQGISDVIGKFSIEKPEAWTRGTFAMVMFHFYKSAGMSLKEAVIKADKDTSTLFVDYSAQERAMMFQRMGEMGKLASTVSTFKLNNLNQWFTFSNKKMYGTLAALALTSWFTTGLFGMPGGDEAEFGASYLKSKGMDIPTPREFMLSEVPGWVSFGPLSKALTPFGGPDTSLHRKFAQDNVVPDDLASFIYPLLSFYTNKIDKGHDWVKSGFAKQEGAVLAREMVPGNLKYGVDYLGLTNEKGLTIDPNQIHNANPAHYDRTKSEWKLAAALGITSQREFKAKQMNQLDKISEQAWKTSTTSKVRSTMSAFNDGDQAKFKKLYQEAVRYNPNAAAQIAETLNSQAIAASVPLETMLELQFAKRATNPHGVKGLQQFQKMQGNK